MQKVFKNYIVVTPCKNEEVNLPKLIQSVAEQNIKPSLWVIVDDGSTDSTSKIIKDAKQKYGWIHSIQTGGNKRDLGVHFASISNKGFDFAIEYCIKNEINYGYLGSLDGDMILENTYFENLIKEFEKDARLGIAGGGIRYLAGDHVISPKGKRDEPSGGNMLIRRECFEECGGIPLSYSPDSVLKVKARLAGWETKRFNEYITTEIRDVYSAEGHLKGYIQEGKSTYYRNMHPIHVILKSIKISFRRPYYIGVAYFLGYFGDFLQRKDQINDEEIKKYYWNKWKKILRY